MKMFAITPQDLDVYLVMDHRQMKVIDANYNVRMGYRASKITCKSTSLCHHDMDVRSGFIEYLATSS